MKRSSWVNSRVPASSISTPRSSSVRRTSVSHARADATSDALARAPAKTTNPSLVSRPRPWAPRWDVNGMRMAAGWLHCPSTPDRLADIPWPGPGASRADRDRFTPRIAERQHYAMDRHERTNHNGRSRWMCPAMAGKLGCPLRDGTVEIARQAGLPLISDPPDPATAPACCTNTSGIVAARVEELRKHDQPHYCGSDAWKQAYDRRTYVEGLFGSIKNSDTSESATRGFIKYRGLPMISLGLTLAAASIRHQRKHYHDRPDAPAIPYSPRTPTTTAGPDSPPTKPPPSTARTVAWPQHEPAGQDQARASVLGGTAPPLQGDDKSQELVIIQGVSRGEERALQLVSRWRRDDGVRAHALCSRQRPGRFGLGQQLLGRNIGQLWVLPPSASSSGGLGRRKAPSNRSPERDDEASRSKDAAQPHSGEAARSCPSEP